MTYPIALLNDLSSVVPQQGIQVQAQGHNLVADLQDWGALWRLIKSIGSRARRMRFFTKLHEGLLIADLTLDIRLRGHRLARLGAGADAGGLAALLGLGPLQVDPARLIRASAPAARPLRGRRR